MSCNVTSSHVLVTAGISVEEAVAVVEGQEIISNVFLVGAVMRRLGRFHCQLLYKKPI